MADNYTQFSFAVDISEDEKNWVTTILEGVDEQPCDWEISCPGNTLYFQDSGGYGDLEAIATFLQTYLIHFHPDETIGFTWAETCSKPRVDEFGGGACLVTAPEIKWMNTHQWLDEARKGNTR